jgi:hypothetical protein
MPAQLSDLIISFLRTLAATVAGAIITWLVAKGVGLDDTLKAPVTEVLFALFSAGYYLVIRLFEQYVSAHAGWLLAVARKPAYVKPLS